MKKIKKGEREREKKNTSKAPAKIDRERDSKGNRDQET